VIVRWGLAAYSDLLRELGISRPLLITTPRWLALQLPAAKTFDGVEPHVPSRTVEAASAAAEGCDGLVAVGGGSAIDTAKAVSVRADVPVLSIPTTFSGAEWTRGFGILEEATRTKQGGGGARIEGILYDSELTRSLPRDQTVGTSMNALAHCAEALYVEGHNDEADREALAGAALISAALPQVLESGDAHKELLEGAMHAGAALAGAGLGLAHAMAQALGGRFGIAHGGANALVLAPALRFNEPVASEEIARFAAAMGVRNAPSRVEELARLGGFERLRDLGIPEDELPAVAEAAAVRPGARANPRKASPDEIADLLRTVW
jgi:alcohol dehydrogenase class IV